MIIFFNSLPPDLTMSHIFAGHRGSRVQGGEAGHKQGTSRVKIPSKKRGGRGADGVRNSSVGYTPKSP